MRIEVKRDIEGKFADEQIALKAGTYWATPVRSGCSIPGQDMPDMPIGRGMFSNKEMKVWVACPARF